MITVVKIGTYELAATGTGMKLIQLDTRHRFVWSTKSDQEFLQIPPRRVREEKSIASGKYRLYEVKNEPLLADFLHLELSLGRGMWQGYLLPDGLPRVSQHPKRIITTDQQITITSRRAAALQDGQDHQL